MLLTNEESTLSVIEVAKRPTATKPTLYIGNKLLLTIKFKFNPNEDS